jgi:hypothetical protein
MGPIATKIDHSGHFRLSLNSGSTEDIARGPIRADFVAKVGGSRWMVVNHLAKGDRLDPPAPTLSTQHLRYAITQA